jgi:hypothetical protein
MDSAPTTPPLDEIQYEHKSGIGYATKVGMQAGGVGALMACLQRIIGPPLMPQGSGFWSIASRNVGFFGESNESIMCSRINWRVAAMGATFAFTETMVANQRQKNDPLNGMAGGCAAGFLAGIRGVLKCHYISNNGCLIFWVWI